ncbi:MAG: CDP-alcohol phosphatidyltransferase family protein [Nitrospiraceae bacterium]|nr:CDP-alcohol phosphatidyltransferase family protein [Nitrospiraceae bacterium]MDA8325539.1 CDP-alcohol phosphatidyltransferase family protein [Nitrospiraceae bacterium]
MISSRLVRRLEIPLAPVIRRIKINPNAITLAGFLVTSAGAGLLASNFQAGGVVVLLGSLCDVLDGMVARVNVKTSALGAYLDSVLDRYSDGFIFLGIAYHLRADMAGVFLSLGTLLGAYLVSYARARAEGLGVECKVGIMERPERIIIITAGAISGQVIPALWVLFVLSHVTVLQRMAHTKKELDGRGLG